MSEKRFNIEDGYYQGKSRPLIYDEESSDDYYFCGDYEDFKSICKQFNDFDIENKNLKKENRELQKFKDKVFNSIDKTIESETQIAENIESTIEGDYVKAVNRLTIIAFKNLKKELSK